jgi:hypothetical protein
MAEKDSITSGNGKSVKNLCLTIDEWDALHTLADQQRALSDALFLAVDNDIREDSLSTISSMLFLNACAVCDLVDKAGGQVEDQA